jgi:hypothetical protein
MPRHTSHLTTEQLSAFLDQQLSAQEQSTCQTHLHTCQHCQQQLTELEQTVLLMCSLPQVPLPRSFVLPIESTVQSKSLAIAGNAAPKTAKQAHNRVLLLPRYARTTMRIASALVAVLGLLFTLSGLLTIVFPNAAKPLVSAPSGKIVQVRTSLPTPIPAMVSVGAAPPSDVLSKGEANHSPIPFPSDEKLVGAAPPSDVLNKDGATLSSSTAQKQTPSHVPATSQQFFDPSTPEGHLSIGLLLLILGTVSGIYATKLGKKGRIKKEASLF